MSKAAPGYHCHQCRDTQKENERLIAEIVLYRELELALYRLLFKKQRKENERLREELQLVANYREPV